MSKSASLSPALYQPSAPTTMKTAVLVEPGCFQLEETPVPQPGPGEARIRLEGCGVCASNLPVWEGREWFDYPLPAGRPGHEGWGIVDAVGAGVDRSAVGQRVAFLSDQAYAEYDLTAARTVTPLPESLAGQPFPGEPLGCAFNVFRRSNIQAGQTVAIVGAGFLGVLLVYLAAQAQARVIAISRRPCALEMARRYGAAETIPMDDHWRIIDRVKTLTGGAGCDCVIEAVGRQWPLDLAAELTIQRGRLVIAGYHQDGPRQVNMQLWNWRGLDVINAHERAPEVYAAGMRAAAAAVDQGDLDPTPLYTHTYSLDQLSQALQMMQSRPEGYFKALITF